MTEPIHPMPTGSDFRSAQQPPVRWWPAALIIVLAGFTVLYFRVIREDSQQWRNIHSMETVIVAIMLLLLWVLFGSRLRWRVRWLVFGSVVGFIALLAVMFRIHGVTGDLVPVLKFRWSRPALSLGSSTNGTTTETSSSSLPGPTAMPTKSYPQFLGADRNATLWGGPKLSRDWTGRPPEKLWCRPIGAAWSGFAIVGNL